ncbi:MAG: hypothetical protein ACT6Q7_02940 [Blastomonas fulva]|uniref:hypothetical protein n=1 Tax=Blastomonas fulva TaxID=1550728 RepID=UPI00403355F2
MIISYWPPTWLVEGDPFALGFNGQNGPFTIKIARQAPDPAAVWAQERYEWGFKWRWGIAFATPVAGAAVHLMFWPLLLVAFAVALWAPRLLQREMELRGHAIEAAVSVALYGAVIEQAEWREVLSLLTYPPFKRNSAERVAAEIKALRGWAERTSRGMGADKIKQRIER